MTMLTMQQTMHMTRRALLAGTVLLILIGLLPGRSSAQVTPERLLDAAQEPHNWLTYSGTYSSERHSTLSQITRDNVADLEMKWVFQSQTSHAFQATPLVVDGIMYLTQPPNDVVALDAKTGRVFWVYEHIPSPDARPCCGFSNRGLAIHGDTLLMGTIDAMVVAVDARSGGPLWKTQIADPSHGYAVTHAPLVVKDKVIVGTAGGDMGIRGFIAAYDVATGEEAWRFYTIPAPGEPGHETWERCRPGMENCDPDAWQTGGGAIWLTGSYDPETNLTFWGVGNPGPDYSYYQRPGDNLYASSVVALDADTGELDWHFQFTPGDRYDYDAVQIPVLVDLEGTGGPIKAMLWANRNGFFYVLDRVTGRFLTGTPFVQVNWAEGLDDIGTPVQTPQGPDRPTYPGKQGGTNWYSPSYSPTTGLMYFSTWEGYATIFDSAPVEYTPGQSYTGSRNRSLVKGVPEPPAIGRGPINTWTREVGHGSVLAFNPVTGKKVWQWETYDVQCSGILTTATDLLFVGGREGYFQALDARTGDLLWRAVPGGNALAAPITYAVDGQQYVAIASGHSLFVFGLPVEGAL